VVEVGPRDIDGGVVSMMRRDRGPKERENVPRGELVGRVGTILGEMQKGLFDRALAFQQAHTKEITDKKELEAFFAGDGGFAKAPFVDDKAISEALAAMKATVRCIPLAQDGREATCMFTGKKTKTWAIYAKAY
jgi:prolyl-tRNA synthetase